MKLILKILIVLVLVVSFGVCVSAEDLETAGGEAAPLAENKGTDSKSDLSKNVTIDMKVLYGRYNNMLSTINLSQEQNDFVYLLSANFKRSNDFGYNDITYENSSYYENKLGFTGNLQLTESWRVILDTEVNGDSRGMFDNTVYSREEKEKSKVSVKNVAKLSTAFEGYITVGGAQYVHRLRPLVDTSEGNSKLKQVNAEVGGEYIWSPTNRIRFNSIFYYYDYSVEDVRCDRFLNSEIIDDFYITRNIGISMGLNVDWNRDGDFLASPILTFLIKDYRFATIGIGYRYDLVPFRPENYYLEQKYIMPAYDLPPARVHRGHLQMEFRMNSFLDIKSLFSVEKSDNYYNYFPVTGNVLSADTLPVINYRSKIGMGLFFFERILEFETAYEYSYFDADLNVTYHPTHQLSGAVKYNGELWRFSWVNRFQGQVYTDPRDDRQLGGFVVGEIGIQRKMLESFFGYIKIENLYNRKYFMREGYPEQGLSFMGGVRILI